MPASAARLLKAAGNDQPPGSIRNIPPRLQQEIHPIEK